MHRPAGLSHLEVFLSGILSGVDGVNLLLHQLRRLLPLKPRQLRKEKLVRMVAADVTESKNNERENSDNIIMHKYA
ncbi:hypothetical protein OESDEN_09000 [Oesophagostomum dentatum]|uniref:Uncharacterized protein n=1 Tax=Oesophagostomum dentatum TaxID=61180 RepID=A0A0B1T4W9_OESDE|nr:hypothetical protein OESDEN_09000 [Oesophagostomum dentatum]